jgi:hypothetical protein
MRSGKAMVPIDPQLVDTSVFLIWNFFKKFERILYQNTNLNWKKFQIGTIFKSDFFFKLEQISN